MSLQRPRGVSREDAQGTASPILSAPECTTTQPLPPPPPEVNDPVATMTSTSDDTSNCGLVKLFDVLLKHPLRGQTGNPTDITHQRRSLHGHRISRPRSERQASGDRSNPCEVLVLKSGGSSVPSFLPSCTSTDLRIRSYSSSVAKPSLSSSSLAIRFLRTCAWENRSTHRGPCHYRC